MASCDRPNRPVRISRENLRDVAHQCNGGLVHAAARCARGEQAKKGGRGDIVSARGDRFQAAFSAKAREVEIECSRDAIVDAEGPVRACDDRRHRKRLDQGHIASRPQRQRRQGLHQVQASQR